MKFNAKYVKRLSEKKRNIYLIKVTRNLVKRLNEPANYFNYGSNKIMINLYNEERAIFEDNLLNIKKLLKKRKLLIKYSGGNLEIMPMEQENDKS